MRVLIGIALLVFGAILVAVGGASYKIVKDNVTTLAEEYDQLESTNSPRLPNLLRTQPELSPKYTFYVFNYTNLAEFLNGTQAPQVTVLGPYVFRFWSKEQANVRFVDDGNILAWNFVWTWTFLPEESASQNATFFSPKLSYFQLMRYVGGVDEDKFWFGLVSYLTVDAIYAWSYYAPDQVWTYAADLRWGAKLMESKIEEMGLDNFTANFINGTLDAPFQLPAPVSLTLEQGKLLFDPTRNSSLLYLEHIIYLNPAMLWYQAFMDPVVEDNLRSVFISFGVSGSDFDTIFSWRTTTFAAFIRTDLQTRFGLRDWTAMEVYYLQIAQDFMAPLGITGVISGLWVDDFEIPALTGNYNITVNETRSLFERWMGQPTNIQTRLVEMKDMYEEVYPRPSWVSSDSNYQVLSNWWRILTDYSVGVWDNPDLNWSGTVSNLLHGGTDSFSLASNVLPSYQGVCLLETVGIAGMVGRNFSGIVKTGKNNASEKKQMVQWAQFDYVGWATNNYPFGGYWSLLPDVPAFPERKSRKFFFEISVYRQVEFSYNSHGKYDGLSYDEYTVDFEQESLRKGNPEYNNPEQGIWALADLATRSNGAGVFSLPYFYAADPDIQVFWKGQFPNTEQNWKILTDPVTGIAIKYEYSYQTAYQMTPTWFKHSFQNIVKPSLYLPSYYTLQQYEIAKVDRDNVKTWQSRYHLRIVIPAVGCTVGGVLMVVGIVLIVLSLLKGQSD